MRLRQSLCLLLLAFLPLCAIMAQSTSAVISGLVADPSGRAIPGAEIEVVNNATGVRRTSTTNSDGIYEIPNLPPGIYRLQVSKRGFKTLLKPGIVLRTEDALAINFTLPVGATIETVTVEGGDSSLNTQSASVSTVIDHQFVENLPLNGRSFNTLLQLTPGVVIAQQPAAGSLGGAPGQFSIGGQRTDANNFTVDGVSANFGVSTTGVYSGDSGTGTAQAFSVLGGTSSLVSVEDLQEFRVETSSFAPEFGKTPGGQVMLTTRSGTNHWHGGLYEYFRNDVMDANNWFADNAGEPRPAERHNDFGGFLGGAIIPGRTFFFFSYEGARLRLPQTTITQEPWLNDTTCVAPAAVAPLLAAFPKPNSGESGTTCTGLFTGSYSNSATLDATSLRIDHTLSSRVSLFARYNYAPSTMVARQYALSMLAATPVRTQTATIGVNTQLGRMAADTLRANYSEQSSDDVNSLDSFGGATPLSPSLLLGSLPAASDLGEFDALDSNFYATGPVEHNRAGQVDVVDDLDWSVGSHQLKFGVDYRTISLDKVAYNAGISMLALSVPDLIRSGTVDELGLTRIVPAHFVTDSTSVFAQDSWKAMRGLTVTWGLRWELDPAPSPRKGTLAAAWRNVNSPGDLSLAPWGTPLWSTTWGNLAPRLGIAWRPAAFANTVIRGGVGLFYDLGSGGAADAAAFFPGSISRILLDVPLPYAAQSSDLPEVSLAPPYPLVKAFDPGLVLPRSWEWNLAVEKGLSGHQAATITYVGQDGEDQLRQQDYYQPNANFSSAFLFTNNSAWSNYNSLQLQYRATLPGRLQTLLNYTYAHSLDNASDDAVLGLANTIVSGARDYSSSDFDVRHSFSGAVTATLPPSAGSPLLRALEHGWSLAGVAVLRTGFPFNATYRGLSAATGGYAAVRPDLVSGQPLWMRNPGAATGRSLNPAAFSIPAAPRQGTESRNDISGFGLKELDCTLGRSFPLLDGWQLKFDADAFNILNHPDFANPEALLNQGPTYLESTQMLNTALGGLNPLFQEGGPRSLQLSLKLSF
ncbi:MAG: carboxypeptidase regulatory-like domain-containing protein [Acidobacteriota bacterium]